MDDLTKWVQSIKELANELGRTPLRLEIESRHLLPSNKIKIIGYNELIAMAGLTALTETERKNVKKITNDIFNRNIDQHLEDYVPRKSKPQKPFSKILCWPDSHYPFVNKEAEQKMIKFAIENQPDYIIQIGDMLDFYSASKFPRSQNVYTPKEEERLGIEMATNAWKQLREGCPKAKCYQLMGNHDVRPLKRTLESLPIAEHWMEAYFKQLFTFEGVETVFDTRQELEIDGILFTHGFLSPGTHKDYYLKNVIHGHDHKLYVQHRRIHGQNIFEMSCGFLGDVEAKALSYTPSKLANFQLGFGWVDQWGARTIHL